MNTAQTSDVLEAPVRLPSAQLPAVVSPPKAIMQEVDRLLEIHEHGNQEEFEFSSNANHTPSSQTHEPGSTFASRSESSKGSHRHSEQIYDEIESDTESFHERQKLHRPKRLKLDYISRQRTSPHQNSHDLPVDRHDGPFLVPPIPASGNRKSTPSGELEGSQQSQGAVSSKNSSENPDAQHVDARNGSSLVPYPGSIRDVPMKSNQPPEEVITNGEGDTGHEVQPKDIPSFQAIATCSQMPQKSTKNFKDLDEDHPIKVALSQTRKPDLSTMVNSGVHDGTQISKSIVQPRKSQRTAVESGKQKQGDERTEEPTEAQPAPDRTVDENTREETEERVDHRTEENSGQGKDEEIHSVEQTGPQQLEEAAQGTSKSSSDGTTGSAKEALPQPEQSRNNSENNKTPSGGRQSKESTLVEQAERMMLEKEGANQLQFEKVQKQQTPKVLQPHKSDAKVPSSTRNKPRTEEQKAARRERETKQRAEQRAVQSTKAKSVESKGNPNWAERLFRTSGNDFRQSSEHIDTDSEKEENPKRQADTKSSASAIYNCKPIPDDLDARSSSPSGVSRLGQNRKSLTPAVPNAAAFKPASSKGSLASSSPLASRSSVTSNTPLRSALKHNQTPSTIRRSVSFIDSEENNRSAPKPSNFPAFPPSVSRPFKSLVDLNNELALKEASLSEVTKTAGSDANHRKKATSKAVAEKDKVQQKLNVTRDKKLKGRAVEPPSPPKSQTKPAHDSSSIDEFLFPDSSSDEDFVHGNAKAGPSSRKKTPVAFRSQADFANKLLSRLTPTDPAVENTRAQEKTTDSPLPSRSSSISKASSRPKSISRSPALAVSESISLSSGSSSRSGSVSESGSSSASNIDPELQAESSRAKPSNSKKGDQPAIAERREDDRVGAQVPQTARQTSQVSKTASSSNGARKNDDEAGHQLRHENSQTMPAQAINAGPSSTNKGPHRPQESNRGLKGRLLDSTPTPYRYPTLTAQRRMAEGKPPVAIITPPMSSQKSAVQPPGGTSSSSSGSEDSSSSSEEEGEGRTGAGPASSRTSSKSKSRGFPGLRGVMKRKSTRASTQIFADTDLKQWPDSVAARYFIYGVQSFISHYSFLISAFISHRNRICKRNA